MKIRAGIQIGRLTAADSLGRGGDGTTLWRCDCSCGDWVTATGAQLLAGEAVSCGECGSRAPWSEAEDELMRREYPDTPNSVLAVRLDRTRRAIKNRSLVLGLTKSAEYMAGPRSGRFVPEFPIALMARMLEVSRSGFYAWRSRRGPGPRAQARALLDARVSTAFRAAKERSGSPRLVRDLADAGHVHDRKTVANSMKRQGIRAKAARRFKATTNSAHDLPIAPNLLKQDFSAPAPNTRWVGDITYLWTDEGWLYLAVLIDLYSRAVAGWSMSDRMKSNLVCDAMTMAYWRRRPPPGLITHSDRGSQYCSQRYRDLLDRNRMICSMSRKGNCWDNAVAESFFHTLKVELIHGHRFAERETLRQAVFEYIEVDYNRTRRHSALGYVSPERFEAAQAA